jgi:hypothetical protein
MAKGICRIEDPPCVGPVLCKDLCESHYRKQRLYGDPLAVRPIGRPKSDRGCDIEDCPNPHYGLGWCLKHWTTNDRHGDPLWVPEGTVHRKYDLDDSFFDVIDTEAKAYWLGFITADGCVQAGAAGAAGWQRHSVSVGLKPSDAGHLEKLKADIAAENPVFTSPQVASVALSSIHLTESLIRLGVTPRKSMTATPWIGPDHLMRHYWRGMVDGDGSIVRHAGERDKWRLTLCGTEACMEAFRTWAAPVCGSAARVRPYRNIFTWTAGGLASPQALARELYDGSTVYLDRKYELAVRLIAAPIRHRSWLQQRAVTRPPEGEGRQA